MLSRLFSSTRNKTVIKTPLVVKSTKIFTPKNWSVIDSVIKMKTMNNDECLVFNRMGDIHLFQLKFQNCEYAVFTNCDKNFIYYWMSRSKFPIVKEIYLDNHICEYQVFRWWSNKGITMHISPSAYATNRRWSDEFDYTNKINEETDKTFKSSLIT